MITGLDEYQDNVWRTSPYKDEIADVSDPRPSVRENIDEVMCMGSMGLSGEAGETTDYIKKVVFHKHPLDRQKVIKEMGDVMWYLAFLSRALGIPLSTVATVNIDKLKERYPQGFNPNFSQMRKAEE